MAKLKKIGTVFTCLLFLLSVGNGVLAKEYISDCYVLENGERVSIPTAYNYTESISELADGSRLSNPSDLCIYNNCLYVADTGNNRIVKLDANGQFLEEYLVADHGGLNYPEGVFVLDGHLFIADTENKRVVHLDEKGNFVEEFGKPESELIEDDMVFAPSRIAIDNNGMLYVMCKTKLQGLLMIDARNNFKGYMGSNKLDFSLTDYLVRIFGSEEQKKKIVRRVPEATAGFAYSDDCIYTVVSTENGSSIHKFNSIGIDGYTSQAPGLQQVENAVDIAVKNGIVTIVDQKNCQLYQLDQEGNLLAVFGEKGDIKGQFSLPVAVEMDDAANLYVLDSAKNSIQIFVPTEFIKTVQAACRLYNDGLYASSKEMWEAVIAQDESYTLAFNGIAQAMYWEGEYEQAMEGFRYSEDKEGYSESFDEYRHDLFRQHFALVMLAIVLLAGVFILIVVKVKKYADKKY